MFTTSPETTSFPMVRTAAIIALGSMRYPRRAGHISPAGGEAAKPVRTRRCPATAMPSSGDEPGRLLLPTNSALGGRAVRAAPPPGHLPPLHAEVFMSSRFAGAAALVGARALAGAPAAARPRRSHVAEATDHVALADRDGGSVRDRRRQAGRRGRRPVELPAGARPTRSSPASRQRRGDRREQARPGRASTDTNGIVAALGKLLDPGALRTARRDSSPAPTRRSGSWGRQPATSPGPQRSSQR